MCVAWFENNEDYDHIISDLRFYLIKQDKEELVKIIIDSLGHDDSLFDHLKLRMKLYKSDNFDIKAIRDAIDRYVDVEDYLETYDVWKYAEKLDTINRSIGTLLESGKANEVIDLTEYMVSRIENQLEYIDDSNGEVGDILGDLERMHLKAYQQSSIPKKDLGERLYDLELRSEYTFYEAFKIYADVIGDQGIEGYASRAKEEWDKLQPANPGDTIDRPDYRRRVERIMEAFVRRSDDVETLVSFFSKNLSKEYSYVAIIEAYQEAGNTDKALEWAERGFSVFPEIHSGKISDQLVSLYRERGRHTDALAILWKRFEETPSLHYIQPLEEYTSSIDEWPIWKDRAFSLLRSKAEIKQKHWPFNSGRPELIRALLWDGDIESAWIEANKGDDIPDNIWLSVASAREETHYKDSIAVYRRIMYKHIAAISNGNYDYPAGLLRKIRELMKAHDRENDFGNEIKNLRQEFKRKRNFMRDLDAIEMGR